MNLNYYLNNSAFLEIYNNEPPLNEAYNIGNIAEA